MAIEIVLLLVLLFLSFTFSGSEVAFLSLSPLDLSRLKSERTRRYIEVILKEPYIFLTTVITGNTTVNTFAASIFTAVVAHWGVVGGLGEGLKIFIDIVVFTLIILVAGEITPKIIALSDSITFSKSSLWLIFPLRKIFYPIAYPLSRLLSKQIHGIAQSEKRSFFEIEEAVRRFKAQRRAELDELKVLDEAIWFSRARALDIAVPREEVRALSKDSTLKDAERLYQETKHRKFPVYDGDLDNIVGIFDISLCVRRGIDNPNEKVVICMLTPLFVPSILRIKELFPRLVRTPTKMAIVVDEYGGTHGIITLWDIISAFTGKIKGESEVEEVIGVKKIGRDSFLVPGTIEITELADILGYPIGERGNLSGFLVKKFGYVPREGESIEVGPYVFEVVSSRMGRVRRVKVTRKM